MTISGEKLRKNSSRIDLKRAARMVENDRNNHESRRKRDDNPSDARHPRSIRFSDSEWNLIEQTAARRGIPVGELVRSGAVATAENRLGEPPPATLSTGHAALIEAIYRFVYVMATLKRDELLDAGREKELEDLIVAARRTMAQTMNEGREV